MGGMISQVLLSMIDKLAKVPVNMAFATRLRASSRARLRHAYRPQVYGKPAELSPDRSSCPPGPATAQSSRPPRPLRAGIQPCLSR